MCLKIEDKNDVVTNKTEFYLNITIGILVRNLCTRTFDSFCNKEILTNKIDTSKHTKKEKKYTKNPKSKNCTFLTIHFYKLRVSSLDCCKIFKDRDVLSDLDVFKMKSVEYFLRKTEYNQENTQYIQKSTK